MGPAIEDGVPIKRQPRKLSAREVIEIVMGSSKGLGMEGTRNVVGRIRRVGRGWSVFLLEERIEPCGLILGPCVALLLIGVHRLLDVRGVSHLPPILLL